MSTTRINRGLYLITEHVQLDFASLLAITESVLPLGISVLQYRNKSTDYEQKMEQARQLQQLCQTYKVPFIINDDLQLAISLGADGVHLGRDDGDCKSARLLLGAQKLIGVSCYNDLARAEQAVNEGADYIAFGAMFATSTKTNTVHASTDLITQAKQRYTVPLVAIGGITPENCEPIIVAGADLLATVSSVYLASNPSDVVIKFNQQMVKYSS